MTVPKSAVTIRPATPGDVEAIFDLLQRFSQKKLLLSRDRDEIQKHLFSFFVACAETGEAVGCVCLRKYADDLYEVRSLAVDDAWQDQRIGSRLVQRLIDELSATPNVRLFALTYRAHFFLNLGFHSVVKEYFPEKIWADCVNCPKRHCCDEDAVLYITQPNV